MSDVKFPQVKVQLVGQEGNAFSIMGRCAAAARRAGVAKVDIDAFYKEATSGNYDHLLQTCMAYFDCDGEVVDDEDDEDEEYHETSKRP